MNERTIARGALSIILLALVAQIACAGRACADPPEGELLRVVSFCEYTEGPGCQPIDDAPEGAELVQVSWCCDYATGDCVDVASILACDPVQEYAVICEWGASVPQSSSIGSVDCYE